MSETIKTTATDEHPIVHGTFSVERHYPADPARVFNAYADEATKRRWFVEGEGWEIYEYKMDFRVDGAEMSRFSYQGGPEIRFEGIYQGIIPNRRIVMTYRMDIAGKPLSVSLCTTEIVPSKGGTLVTYTEQGVYYGSEEDIKNREHGCRELLGKLAEELAGNP
jgi:uncharacterized protein YndB with AHSA1/START domain